MPRPHILVALMLLTACAPPAVEAVSPSPASSSTAIAAASSAAPIADAPPPTVATPCEILWREQRDVLRPLWDEHRRTYGSFDARSFVHPLCWPDELGAWGASFSRVTVIPSALQLIPFRNELQPSFKANVTYVRLGRDGRRMASAPSPIENAPDRVEAFDWDGDGVDELVVPADGQYRGLLTVLSARGGDVHPFPIPVHPRMVKDIDGDGHMDLLYTEPFDATLTAYEERPVEMLSEPEQGGFWLMAHALPDGRFALDDDAARAFAKLGCPSGELTSQKEKDEPLVSISNAASVRCARLWGRTAVETRAFVDRSCKGKKQCANENAMRQWAAVTPPLTLR